MTCNCAFQTSFLCLTMWDGSLCACSTSLWWTSQLASDYSAKASLTKTNTLQYQFSWKPEVKMRAYWLVLIRGKKKKKKEGKAATTATTHPSYHSPTEQAVFRVICLQTATRTGKQAHPGPLTSRLVSAKNRVPFSKVALHNSTGLSTGQKGGTGSSQGVFGHNLRKQIFKQAF